MKINLLEYLEETAARFPDKSAFCDEKRSFSFGELLSFSRRLGTKLASLGVLRRPVAVFVGRDAVSIALFFSVLQAGGFYVPIDPTQPEARLRSMLSELHPAALLARPGEAVKASVLTDAPILTEEDAAAADPAMLNAIRADLIDLDPAYLIYTSGSTGTPKGIVVSHRSAIDLAEWLTNTFGFTSDDVLGNQTPFYFDASVKEIVLTVCCGLTTHILSKKLFMFPSRLIDALNEKQVTSILWATSAVNLTALSGILSTKVPVHLRRVFFAGEAMTGRTLSIWQRALPEVQYINLYGPTETTVDCSYYLVDREFADEDPVPIGHACRNMQLLLLDESLKPVPQGEVGEIYVRGTGVALGYYGDKERTDAAFLQNPQNPYWNDLLYKTGDLARENERGELVFVGRSDDQCKRHGNRIELGEIEAAARALPNITEALCLFDREADKLTLVYSGTEQKDSDLLKALSQKLPRYMLPDQALYFPALPHNANGKLDRNALRRML